MQNKKSGSDKDELYGDDFYKSQMDGSYLGATRYVQHLLKIYRPRSVADVGCGRGTWLKAFRESGVEKVFGFDGIWNSQEKMIDGAIRFFPADLNKPISTQEEKFDLAISLEVAEHLKEESAGTFVRTVTGLSDVVMFSAAYTRQGGTDHINEQPHTYWARMFIEQGYMPYDVFRPVFWGDPAIEFWYQQNTFLYVKNQSDINRLLKDAGYQPMANIKFMDCVHPALYGRWAQNSFGYLLGQLLLKVIPNAMLPLARKVKKLISKLIALIDT